MAERNGSFIKHTNSWTTRNQECRTLTLWAKGKRKMEVPVLNLAHGETSAPVLKGQDPL